jgi:MFS family permease
LPPHRYVADVKEIVVSDSFSSRAEGEQPDVPSSEVGQRFGLVQWLIVGTSALGFALDIYELLMLPLIVGPALRELLPAGSTQAQMQDWVGIIFFVPAIVGGLFGLLGGYMTDRLGRRRVLVYTVLIYQLSACLAAYSTSVWMFLVLRCTTFMGVCIEFVAAVAWLAELFPQPRQRETVLGYTQAFSSAGGFLVAGVYGLVVAYHDQLPGFQVPDFLHGVLGTIQDPHASWRYMLMSGLIPALPLILIRPFLPESPIWRQKKAAGTLKRPSLVELFRPRLCRTTIITTLMFACSYGAAFGAIQHLPRIVPALPELRDFSPDAKQQTVKTVQLWQESGGLVGRFLLAYLAVIIVSRQKLMRRFQVPGLILLPVVFAYAALHDLMLLQIGIFLVGLLTVAQFSFWGNYLPRVYPVHLRGTGESFAANVGGRMAGTSAALVTTQLAKVMPGTTPAQHLAYAAAVVGLSVYALGVILSFWLPEPRENEMSA